jgi:hypothetical protein
MASIHTKMDLLINSGKSIAKTASNIKASIQLLNQKYHAQLVRAPILTNADLLKNIVGFTAKIVKKIN